MEEITPINSKGRKAGDMVKDQLRAIFKSGWIFEKPLEKIILVILNVLGAIKFIEIIS